MAKDNLGTNPSLLAASALMIDYVLNVAVGISAGVAAFVSAVPALHPHILSICLGILAFVTIMNLRGTLSSNTRFVDFPRLCRAVAEDGFLPRPFAIAGHRLVFSIGIIYLAVVAGLLLVVFGGITDHLIPLFAVGAFSTFTISQTGMVVHWLRELKKTVTARERHSIRIHLLTNGLGALTTATALVVIVIAKFEAGAWITLIVVPGVILLLESIRRYYDRLSARVRDPSPLKIDNTDPPIVLVAIDEWNQLADKALTLALRLSPDVIGVHLTQLFGPQDTEQEHRRLQNQWLRNVVGPAKAAGYSAPPLIIMPSQYRTIHEPMLKLVHQLERKYRDRVIAVLIPELVKQRWYQSLLHTNRARQLHHKLLRCGGARLTIIDIPWYLDEPAKV